MRNVPPVEQDYLDGLETDKRDKQFHRWFVDKFMMPIWKFSVLKNVDRPQEGELFSIFQNQTNRMLSR